MGRHVRWMLRRHQDVSAACVPPHFAAGLGPCEKPGVPFETKLRVGPEQEGSNEPRGEPAAHDRACGRPLNVADSTCPAKAAFERAVRCASATTRYSGGQSSGLST